MVLNFSSTVEPAYCLLSPIYIACSLSARWSYLQLTQEVGKIFNYGANELFAMHDSPILATELQL